MKEVVYNLEFYENNNKIALQTKNMVVGYDVLTHLEHFKIQGAQSTNELRKLKILYDTYISFLDLQNSIFQFDVNYRLNPDYLNLVIKPIQNIELRVNDKHTINHCAWTAAGSHFILQMKENELMLVKNPFLHH